ncbi:unnamed protein product [Somion occarium]|uniref:Uncharacterized protein n=1 Tax=Somion occarium TaxID=3059160 RepID=A0ABP1DXG8_9APHY
MPCRTFPHDDVAYTGRSETCEDGECEDKGYRSQSTSRWGYGNEHEHEKMILAGISMRNHKSDIWKFEKPMEITQELHPDPCFLGSAGSKGHRQTQNMQRQGPRECKVRGERGTGNCAGRSKRENQKSLLLLLSLGGDTIEEVTLEMKKDEKGNRRRGRS